jgi:AcrR family transcriptional regulator
MSPPFGKKQAAVTLFSGRTMRHDGPVPNDVSSPKQDRSRATRDRLLEAAVASLAESGWSRTTVATVATRAGVSRGAAQHHFRTRGDLVTAAIRHMTEIRLGELRTTVKAPPEGADRTRWALDRLVGLYTSTLFTAALHVWAEAAVDAALRAQVIPLERTLAWEAYQLAVTLLDVDGHDPRVRTVVSGTLDLARGLGLANVLTDDTRRRSRILDTWARELDLALARIRAQAPRSGDAEAASRLRSL